MNLRCYLTPEHAAELLGLSARTVRRRLQAGELAGLQVGKQWRVEAAACQADAPAVLPAECPELLTLEQLGEVFGLERKALLASRNALGLRQVRGRWLGSRAGLLKFINTYST